MPDTDHKRMLEMAAKQTIILQSSAEAATYRTDICGWVSRDGRYYGNDSGAERTARYAGSTHSECRECGAICDKGYTLCDNCRGKAELARFLALPRAPWDGVQMIYSDAKDRYYNTLEDALEDFEEDTPADEMRLLLCEPNRPRLLEEDFFADEMPEDGDYYSLPKELQEAIEAYNAVAKNCSPLSWHPGKVALDLGTDIAAAAIGEKMP